MNKKLLICGAIATALLVTACVKKEAPKEEQQEQAASTAQPQPAQFESLESTATSSIPATVSESSHVEVEHQESNNTSATIRREAQTTDVSAQIEPSHVEEQKPAETKPAKAESVKTETQQAATPKPKPTTAQSEDDAVAAAIAAATPALKN
ncbi:internalin [Acinetobacter silvestris]|uniref:Internalin n=1 Tax=Acinetobacter silvestris TaxID=1977882 RepID=A0A1Y3CKF2_9GAMM|nr:internalin [Acinetobacter silvestris]OTG66359.1 internalin [Acinetobacter silvestris]